MSEGMEIEHAVIGCLMADNSLLSECPLTHADFESEACSEVYTTISGIVSEGELADVVTVMDELRNRGCPQYVKTAANAARDTASTANFKGYVGAVRSASQRRRAKSVASILQSDIDKHGVDAVDSAIRDLMALTQERKDHSCQLRDALREAVDDIDRVQQAGGELVGVTTGLSRLDDALGGWQDTDLTIIGARPAMGKTALLLGFSLVGGEYGPVGVISGEQPRKQVGLRVLSSGSGLSAHKLRRADVEEEEWARLTMAVSKYSERRVYIHDQSGPTIADVVRQARQWKHRYGIRALYVDYLQRIRGEGQSRLDQVSDTARRLKDLARELEIPVVALGQVKREVETRDDKRPGMADLSDSSEIEKEADQIITLYRDEVYNKDTDRQGVAELLICKNRHGPTGRIAVTWLKDTMRFEDMYHGDVD